MPLLEERAHSSVQAGACWVIEVNKTKAITVLYMEAGAFELLEDWRAMPCCAREINPRAMALVINLRVQGCWAHRSQFLCSMLMRL